MSARRDVRDFAAADIARVHAEHWHDGMGTVSAAELTGFLALISAHRPASFVEVGTASGLSGGLIARILEAHGGRRFVTVDHDNTFFGDPTKENGYLIPAVYGGGPVEVVRLTGLTSIDLPGRGETFDMAFVDANHRHPWPLIDTLCLQPLMTGPRIVIHDDLNLYRHQPTGRGIGPKHLYDQVPPEHRTRWEANHGNVFSMRLDLDPDRFERLAMDAFAIPWTLTDRLQGAQLDGFRSVLAAHYSERLQDFFERMLERYNVPTGRFYRRPQRDGA